MAARLPDRQKKKIVADYLESGRYRATGRKNGVSDATVKRIIEDCGDIQQKIAQKKEENTADVLAYMESKRQKVCDIIEIGLQELPEKLQNAKTATEITTALGTLIDKWALKAPQGMEGSRTDDDPITRSLKESVQNGSV